MKRLLLIALALLCAIMCVCLASCSEEEDGADTHTHSFGDWNETKAPTCTENGEMTQKCSCGEKKTHSVSPLGHSYKSEKCSSCDYVIPESTGLEFTSNGDGTCYVSGMGTCTASEILIPTEYEGMTVTGIGNGAFENCTVIVIIIIPDSITSIGENAFAGCTGLNTACVSQSVKSIGDGAFENCTNLVVIIIGEGLESIGARAFAGCGSLQGLFLPSTLVSIGENAFMGCIKAALSTVLEALPSGWVMGEISVNLNHQHTLGEWVTVREASCKQVGISHQYCECGYKNIEIAQMLEHTVEKIEAKEPSCIANGATEGERCAVCGTITVKPGVIPTKPHNFVDGACTECNEPKESSTGLVFEVSGDGATLVGIGSCQDTVIIVPSSYSGKPVKYVKSYAFQNNKTITKIYLPSSIVALGSSTFYGCTALESVVLPKSIMTIDASVFFGCTSLSEISIPEKVFSIESSAFRGCKSLRRLELTEGLRNIGAYAFYGCESLESITLPSTLTTIKENAFYNCNSLETVSVGEDCKLEEIGEYAFFNCQKLEKISIPVSIKTFKASAFMYCVALKDVNYYGGIEQWCAITVEGLNASPFSNGASLCFKGEVITTLTIPSSVAKVSLNAFAGCGGIEKIVVESATTELGDFAFANLADLKEVSLPEGGIKLGSYLFSDCVALEKLIIPEGTKDLPSGILRNCTAITEFSLPRSLESVGYGVLEGCSYEGIIVLYSNVTTVSSRAFLDCRASKICCEATSRPSGWDKNWNCDSIYEEWGWSE